MSGSTEAQTTEGNPNQPNEAMPVSPDATLFTSQTTNRTEQDKACIGILYSKPDIEIAQRFKIAIEVNQDVKALLFHDEFVSPPGEPVVDEIEHFSKECNGFIWIATLSSIHDFEMKYHRSFCQHGVIKNPSKIFVPGIPQENPDIKLPDTLEPYTPLKEDHLFERRVQSTVFHILKKIQGPGNAGFPPEIGTGSAQNQNFPGGPTTEQQTSATQPVSQDFLPNQGTQNVFNITLKDCQVNNLQVAGKSKNKYMGKSKASKKKSDSLLVDVEEMDSDATKSETLGIGPNTSEEDSIQGNRREHLPEPDGSELKQQDTYKKS